MSKRIRELIQLAYETGWASCRIEAPDALAPTDRAKLRAIHPTMVDKRNAARDALEADITALVEAAQALAAREMALRSTGFNAPLGYDSIKSACFSTADSIADLAKALAAFED
ncbi:MAG: hypothetical protein WC565_06745 [Parcubacteria group bacterium]